MSWLPNRRARAAGRSGDRGSVTIETVIMAPVFGAFVAFVIVAGRAQNVGIDVDGAAAQAARTITVSDDPRGAGVREADAVARATVREGSPTCADMTMSHDFEAVEGGEAVRVVISCRVDFGDLTAMPIPGSNTMRGEAREVFDQWTEDGGGG